MFSDINTILSALQAPTGIIFLLLLIAFTGYKKYWVFGWAYTDIKSDRDEWKKVAQEREADRERDAIFIIEQAERIRKLS